MAKDIPDWGRLPKETETQWAHFLVFRDHGYPEGPNGPFRARALQRVADELGLSINTVSMESAGGNWFMRAAAYDREVDAAKVDRNLSAVSKMRMRKEKALSEIDRILTRERYKLMKKCEESEDQVLSVRDQVSLQELVLKHEALLHGITEDTPEDVGVDLESLPLHELEHLDEMVKTYGVQTKH